MLRCPKCGTDNLLSAVFCRGCGERMNLDEIKPDDFANIGTKKDNNTMQNIIGGAIIAVLLIGFIIGFCFPSFGVPGTTEDGQKAALEKYLGAPSGTFTDQEITDLCNAMLARKDVSDGHKVKKIAVTCNDDGTVNTYVSVSFWGFLPGTVKCCCNVNADDTVGLNGGGVKIGLLPLPAGMEESFFWPVRSACSTAMSDLNTKVKEIKVSAGQAEVKHGRVKLDD